MAQNKKLNLLSVNYSCDARANCVSENVWVDDYIVSTSMVLTVCFRKSQALQNGHSFWNTVHSMLYEEK